jgi:hypothetical protein
MSELNAHTYLASRRRRRGYIAGSILGISDAIMTAWQAVRVTDDTKLARGASIPARAEQVHHCEVDDDTPSHSCVD